jgi:type I restriction enzyme S subunit
MGIGGCIHDGFLTFLNVDKRLSLDWLYWYFLFGRSRFERLANDGTQKNLNIEIVEGIGVPLPSLAEQRRIASQLEQADRLRRTRRYTLELSDTFLPATFRKLFGSPREAMMRWPVLALDDCCSRVTDGTHLTPKFESSGVPFVFVKNISNGCIDFSTDKFVSEATFHELTRRCPIEEDDILYTIVGATYGQAVRVGRITKFTFQRHVAHIKPDRSIIEPGYLASIMQLPIVKQQADIWARGAAQPTINLKELKEFKIPVPPPPQQQHFAKLVAQHERLRATQRESLRQAEHLFQTLLHRAFNDA